MICENSGSFFKEGVTWVQSTVLLAPEESCLISNGIHFIPLSAYISHFPSCRHGESQA